MGIGTITAIITHNVTAEMALLNHNIIIPAARTIDNRVVDVKGNRCCERLKIHAEHLMQYMRQGTEGLQMMAVEFEVENKGILILTHVQWLANPHDIRKWKRNGEIAQSLVVVLKREEE